MAKTVTESFKIFASNTNVSDRQVSIVSNCHTNVVKKVGDVLKLHPDQPSKLIGSWDRDTLTRYLSERDVDVMVVLHYSENKDWHNSDGATKALNKIKSILIDAYPKTTCSIDRNCVTMKLSEFRLDVVPAFKFNDGHYSIPDTYRGSGGSWIKTDPVAFSKEVTRINKNMNGTFVPLVKMVKAWNREKKYMLRGFHIECMMIKHYKSYSQSFTYDSTLNVFFNKLPGYLLNASYDPITGDRVDLYLDNASLGNNRDTIVKRAERTAKASQEAYDDAETYPSLSIGAWKDILGEFFPSYG